MSGIAWKRWVAVLVLSLTVVALGRAVAKPAGSELTVAQEGKDVVLSAKVTVNNSPHVLWTDLWVNDSSREVTLRYVVVQNRDLLVRSQKQIDVTWCVPGRAKGADPYRVEGASLTPTTDELKQLLPQVQQLVEQGERRKPSDVR